MIDSLRKKLAKEKHQTDQVLDPLERQLADLDPVVAAMPAAQQDLARQIHQRLDCPQRSPAEIYANRRRRSDRPFAKVTELKGRIADLRSEHRRPAGRPGTAARTVAAGARRSGDLAMAQAQVAKRSEQSRRQPPNHLKPD